MLLENIEQLNTDMEEAKAQLQNDKHLKEIQEAAIRALERKLSEMEENLASGENKNLSVSQIDTMQLTNGSVKFHLGENLQLEDRILSTTVVKLSNTCTMLSQQVNELQDSMRQLAHGLTFFYNQSQKKIEKILQKTCTTRKCIKISRSTQTEVLPKTLLKTLTMESVSKYMPNNMSIDSRKILLAHKKSLISKLHKKALNSSRQTNC